MKIPNEIRELLNYFEAELKAFSRRQYHRTSRLHEACQYALDGEGKRIRPLLCLLANQCLSGKKSEAIGSALALEMIHTYSLIHDDLPCMDDDDLRRGRPTVHKKFDEATALLAGDALLTDAFDVACSQEAKFREENKLAIVQELAKLAGGSGMVYGQDRDMFWTGRSGYTVDNLNEIHINKTGKLIAAACKLGALSAGCQKEDALLMELFGLKLGLAFQIIDDILDESEATGKSVGKDRSQGKLSYLALMDAAEAQTLAESVTKEAFAALDGLKGDTSLLRALGESLLSRTH